MLTCCPDKKAVADTLSCHKEIDSCIAKLKGFTSLGLARTKRELWAKLEKELANYKQELINDELKRQSEKKKSRFGIKTYDDNSGSNLKSLTMTLQMMTEKA